MTFADAVWPHPLTDAHGYLGRERAAHECDLLILWRTPGTPQLVGGVGIAGRAFELGFWVLPSFRRRGFATEAVRAVVAAARDSLKLTHLRARPGPDMRHVDFWPAWIRRRKRGHVVAAAS